MTMILLLVAISFVSALVDHDGWEFHGGKKKRITHGLNLATKDYAPRNTQGQVDFDERGEEKSDIVITNDEAPPAPILGASYANGDRKSARINAKQRLLLQQKPSVLNFDAAVDDDQASESIDASDSWWGRLYVAGFPSHMQYFRAHFGVPHNDKIIRLVAASPPNMCVESARIPILNNSEQMSNSTVIVAVRGGCTFGEKANIAQEVGAAGILFVNNIVSWINRHGVGLQQFENITQFH